MRRLPIVLVMLSCASTGASPDELPWVEPNDVASEPAPTIPDAGEDARPVAPKVPLPSWVDARLDASAVSLIGGDASSIEVLVGQFEHPDEAIVRFDRTSGCASEVIGPFPTISTVVMGRVGFDGPRLSDADLLAAANTGALARELASVVPIYARRGNQGEDKLQLGNDGKHVVMEATDERLIASSDGGAHWRWLDAEFVGMPTMSPTGDLAVVRPCSKGSCGAPPSAARYDAGLVRFDALPSIAPLAGATLHDVIFDRQGDSMVLVRSDAFGRREPTELCLESYALPEARTPSKLACVRTTTAGYWHMTSVSPDRETAVLAVTNRKGKVSLSVRSLVDGRERERIAVADDWEDYQWIDVMVSDRGVVAHRRGVQSSVMGSDSDPGTMVLQGGGLAPREVIGARPLGWLPTGELVWLDRSRRLDAHGCGLVRTETI